ncbi:MAG: 2-succinyl-5-enolpyruvyl-6-hydroxy-3-cyclohexene-1-carboxylic-acid synthase [Sandaracinus sp.]|nr:2-succinyl-5-enolpyruvyl-6-hydroxy-3-cyclohexene-1-carboxylic-acid synthase [Sandaracinus sp.]
MERGDGGQTRFMRHVVDGLVLGGVTDVVLSPGSRSTPLLLAVLHRGLPIHDVVDERAASFFALGLAREGRVPALVCTSGTAPGHYLPAVMEANASRIPLVVVSANRPPELHDTGASQTIDQSRLFGGHVRRFVDLGAPHDSERAMRAAQRRTLRAVRTALGPEPGPVHVDVGARKPLEEHDAGPLLDGPQVFEAPRGVNAEAVAALVTRLGRAERPLIVAGPGGLGQRAWRAAVTRLSRRLGAPVIADAGSQLRFTGQGLAIDGGEALLRTEAGRARLHADLVVQLGDSPIGPGLAKHLAGRARLVLAEGGWPDPEGDAEMLVLGDVAATLDALTEELPVAERAPWFEQPTEALRAARNEALEGSLSQPAAVHAAFRALEPDSRVVLGNSLPIRAVDLYADVDVDLHVVVQRGVSGIDGNLAGSVAVARASGRPTLATVGDVTFLHDLGSLLLARQLDVPLVVLVLNDDGGRIFEHLPVHGTLATDAFEKHFAMTHGLSFEHAAALYRLGYARATSHDDVRASVRAGLSAAGTTIVEVALPTESARTTNARFLAALERSLGS